LEKDRATLMKKKKTISPFQLSYNQEWCPIFGPLPEIEYYSYLQGKCIDIIWEARYIWGVNEWGEVAYGSTNSHYSSRPEPQQIPDYPALLLKKVRSIFDSHSYTRQIALMGRHDNLEYKLTEAIDCVRNILWGDELDYDIIPDYAIVATFALAEAWGVLECVLEYGMTEDNPEVLNALLIAISLLMIAKEKKVEPDVERRRKILHAVMKGQEERQKDKRILWDRWQLEANKIWKINFQLSNSAVARLIRKKLSDKDETKHLVASQQTIRKRIKKPAL
jgi:hypothetical protein